VKTNYYNEPLPKFKRRQIKDMQKQGFDITTIASWLNLTKEQVVRVLQENGKR
jgi:IS30 family transposase